MNDGNERDKNCRCDSGDDEPHEVTIVSVTYTSTHPHTMMIELRNAVVADVTMRSPLWSKNVA